MKFKYRIKITFAHLNPEGTVHHFEYARIFGIVRELFGLQVIPNFKEEIGREYLLVTKDAAYNYFRPFYFGDEMIVKMWVSQVKDDRFTLLAEFINEKDGKVYARGSQIIVHANLKGIPTSMPKKIKSAIENVKEEKSFHNYK